MEGNILSPFAAGRSFFGGLRKVNTPRTDQVVWYDSEAECDVVSADFARELERDLKAALMMCEQNRVLAAQNQVIADNHLAMYRKEHEDFLDMRSIYLARIEGLTNTVRTMRDQLHLLFPEGDAN